jgi:hypothetical protein
MAISRRTQTGDDRRGNTTDRRNRKLWMLATFGDGDTAPCVHCGCTLTLETLEADRIVPGGSYRRDNVQPSCGPDNRSRSNNARWLSPLALAAIAVDDAMPTLINA